MKKQYRRERGEERTAMNGELQNDQDQTKISETVWEFKAQTLSWIVLSKEGEKSINHKNYNKKTKTKTKTTTKLKREQMEK